MKYHTYIHKLFGLSLGLAALATPAYAVFPFPLSSDSSGNIIGGSWSGTGAVQPSVSPGVDPVRNTNPQILVNGFSGTGALTINNMGGTVFSTSRLLTDPLAAVHTITLNSGGTADLRVHNSSSTDGGAYLFNSVGLTGFAGVTSFTYKISFSNPLAGRSGQLGDGITTVDYTRFPVGSGLAMIPGTGLNFSSYLVNLSYANPLFTLANPNTAGEFTSLPSNAVPFTSSFLTADSGSNTDFTANQFDGTVGFSDFLLIRGWDAVTTTPSLSANPNGVLNSQDVERTYITEMEWTVQRDDGLAFPSDAIFVTSMDGQQFTATIPEPTSMLLSAGGLIGACLLRRRRSA